MQACQRLLCLQRGLALLLLGRGAVQAQTPAEPPAPRANIVSISPVELLYKTQLGYEHRTGQSSSVGVHASYHYGALSEYRGEQASVYYRRFLTQQFPGGLYFQFQLSILDFQQTANVVNIKTKQYVAYHYRTTSFGGGIGLGYRRTVLRRATNGRLLGNALLGFRGNPRPQPDYDTSVYRQESAFLGPDFGWYMGFSPGSMVHGLLTLDYQF
ncbi:hypothetical protein MUN81_03925 [Hymenobacter sp. 5317J-9]|uniref:hypothetical protein n=1 Tax=Hymenobacter sp. 5317J-9 TaxID=2932250 RepID=UPI001FD70D7A|nr:hypothetical protein [Hymenobacter sp. 5317J-9]UOQ98645.1 hypothetical protein MUN81_03925 [Hymenobacter sp. 5317J-9]